MSTVFLCENIYIKSVSDGEKLNGTGRATRCEAKSYNRQTFAPHQSKRNANILARKMKQTLL